MSVTGLVRTQYWNVSGPNPTPRTGETSRAETRTDVEGYLLASDEARNGALHGWGVASGLEVSAVAGTAGVTVAPGVVLDLDGHVVVVGAGGVAITDPSVGSTGVQNIPTVPVTARGVGLDTTGLVDDMLLTITWREVEETTGGLMVLRQAPWLRLVDPTTVVDDGLQLVLARVVLGAGGVVNGLELGSRRLVGVTASRLELRLPRASAEPTLAVDQEAAGEVRLAGDGGLTLNLLSAGGSSTEVLVTDAAASTLALLPAGGSVGIGLEGGPPRRTLHVEGSEIHSGGPLGGYSFADRDIETYVQAPSKGERWVWYAQDGEARLWSGEDLLKVRSEQAGAPRSTGVGLDVMRRMRVRSQGDLTAGIWLHQDRDRGFVGMADDTHIGFYGADNAGWGLTMNTATANIGMGIGLKAPAARLHVDGTIAIRASGLTRTGGVLSFLRPGVGLDASGDIGVRSTGRVWAGQFDGDVSISGTLSKGGGGFTIDHPLDPGRKYLSHSFVESPEMLNVYAGTVTTDADGLAWIELPAYFEALNRDITYQLTAVGRPAGLSVAEEVAGNRFAIRSDLGEVTVSWLVTGVRQDPWADAHRIVPEASKPDEAGEMYLHPHVHAVAPERSILDPVVPAPDDIKE